ncbi:MAG TPA: nodulation protein NfeD [Gaiellaceae bacterium]|nr:nodulation protein NfeD [Gaiellaceae bacterium]
MKSACLRGLLLLGALLALAAPADAAAPKVLAIHFAPDLEVNPVTQGWVNHQLNQAAGDGYAAAVIVLDTPGGLSTSMRKIYQKELASRIPVLVYVAPDGARAGSAGLWIAEAADVLAMAPQTNMGASTPISGTGQDLDKDLRKKVVNDAAASIVALAKSHGRDWKFPERAVRQAASIPAPDALRQHVIDVIAPTLPALLKKLDGYKTKPKGFVLHLSGAQIDNVKPGFFTRLLNTLIDPNIISLLFLAGIAGIGYEIFHPGVVLPGALGAVSLVTALYGFSVLPVSWAGLVLLLLGIVLLVADVHVTSHGALTVAGLVCLAVGSIMLFQNAPSPYHTSKPLVIGVAVGLGALWAFAVGKAWQIRHRPVEVDPQRITGSIGEVRDNGLVYVNGELWQARTPAGEQLRPGERVRVESLDGLVLTVRPEGT